jgi:hypothetical protein
MQRIEFAKVTSKNQKTETVEPVENKREASGRTLALTRNVFYLLGSKNVYYVQSEHSNEIYYYVKYNPDVFEYCSCPDNSIRGIKCKHQFAIEHSIRKNTIKEIEHLPEKAQRYPTVVTAESYRDEEYDF